MNFNDFKKYSVAGTFFIWGEKIKGQELLIAKMDQAEHEIGNHSFTHPDFKQLTEKDIQREIDETDKAIQQATGKQKIWFSPPFGHLLENQRKNIDKKITLWTLDSQDWKEETTMEEIYRNVTKHWQHGDVILLHCNERTAQALPDIIKAMQKEGIEGCTMSTLKK
ncbi:polysaccharide deacetylase family protein [Candidatus Enterenecus avicola]